MMFDPAILKKSQNELDAEVQRALTYSVAKELMASYPEYCSTKHIAFEVATEMVNSTDLSCIADVVFDNILIVFDERGWDA